MIKGKVSAASHITEIRYVLGKGVVAKFKPNADDLKMLEMMTTWVTNFAKYGFVFPIFD